MNKVSLKVGTFVLVGKININGTEERPRKKRVDAALWKDYTISRLLRIKGEISQNGYYYYYKWLRFTPDDIISIYP